MVPLNVPFEPLLILARQVLEDPNPHITDLAILFGVNRRSLYRWMDAGEVTFWRADRICTRLGVHYTSVYRQEELIQ